MGEIDPKLTFGVLAASRMDLMPAVGGEFE